MKRELKGEFKTARAYLICELETGFQNFGTRFQIQSAVETKPVSCNRLHTTSGTTGKILLPHNHDSETLCPEAMAHFRSFELTPVTRSRISTALYRTPAALWKGTRAGVKMQFTLSAQQTLEGHRITWTAEIRGELQHGSCATVHEGADQIERKVIEKNAQPRRVAESAAR